MFYFLTLFLAIAQAAAPSQLNLNALLDGVDRSFARMKDLSADFVQIGEDSLNQRQQEAGHLYLMRPQMMRMEYKNPEEKLFVSDGKMIHWYVPADRQVQRDKVRDTIDDRIPLMFLVGRSNLRGEFTRFETLSGVKPVVEGTTVIRMVPKRKTDLKDLVMEVDPKTFQLRRLAMTHADGSHSEFVFSKIQVNTGLKPSLFEFTPPPGVKVLEGIGH